MAINVFKVIKNYLNVWGLPKGVRISSGDQRPLDSGVLYTQVTRRYGANVKYECHDVDGQTEKPVWNTDDAVQKATFGNLVVAGLKRGQFSLANFQLLGGRPIFKVPDIAEQAGMNLKNASAALSEMGIPAGRLDIFCSSAPGLIKGSLSIRAFPELRAAMQLIFVGKSHVVSQEGNGEITGNFPGYFNVMRAIGSQLGGVKDRQVSTRVQEIENVFRVWLKTEGSVYDLWKDFGHQIFSKPNGKLWKSALENMRHEGMEVLEWWISNPKLRREYVKTFGEDAFFVIYKNSHGHLLRKKLLVEHQTRATLRQLPALYPGFVAVVPEGYLLVLWIRHTSVALSGGIPYMNKALPVATNAGLSLHPQLIAKTDVAEELRAQKLCPLNITTLWADLGAKVGINKNLMKVLDSTTQRYWMDSVKPDLVTCYLLGGHDLIESLIKKTSLEVTN